jgi:hypothetical protein
MDNYNEYVPNVHFELIPIKNLVSNQEYQRNLSLAHISRTASHFDVYQINPVKVSRRDGVNYVFNGQHTIEIVASVSGSRETPVWCMIYDDMDYTMEADVFAQQQKFTKALLPFEIFNANLEAGNERQLTIRSLVESYGLTIAGKQGPGLICAISTLEYIYEKYGFHVLDRSLRLCVGTWEGEKNSLSSNMLKGVALLIVAYGDTLKDDLFKDKVGIYSAKELGRIAKERASGSHGYAEAMLIAYNRKMKNGLKWSLLYSNKGKGSKRNQPEDEENYESSDSSSDIQMTMDDIIPQ